MEEKKCKYCAMIIPKEAKICPHCRKNQGTSAGVKFLAIVIAFVVILMIIGSLAGNKTSSTTQSTPTHNCDKIKEIFKSKNFPKYHVVWRSWRMVSVLVDSTTSSDQLKTLICTFRDARNSICLSGYIPATSPGLKSDPHDSPIILVFSDPKWATEVEYKKYEKSGSTSQLSKTYLNHVRAYYERDIDGKEYGSLGYDDGLLKSKEYKKMF